MDRIIIIVLDSVGVGALPDAGEYGDEGANTVGHIAKRVPLALPHLSKIGFSHIPGIGLIPDPAAKGAYGRMAERSKGKDTTTGHWEIAGLTLNSPFPTYPNGFPPEVIGAFEKAIGRGTLGNKSSSGTVILDELGEEHLRTGKPIVYTSADSVFQIAANESIIPTDELYAMCGTARGILQGEHAVGRVIARPFKGERAGSFQRTAGRRDFSLQPTGETMLDQLAAAGLSVLVVGKIEDIFCMRGITESVHAAGNPACVDALLSYLRCDFRGLCFVNLVDFDMVYGHRRDVAGYARCLSQFDARLPEITELMGEKDLLVITADHGCDPTYTGTDHTREYVPLIVWSRNMTDRTDLGERRSFSDIAETVCDAFHLPGGFGAESFLARIEG